MLVLNNKFRIVIRFFIGIVFLGIFLLISDNSYAQNNAGDRGGESGESIKDLIKKDRYKRNRGDKQDYRRKHRGSSDEDRRGGRDYNDDEYNKEEARGRHKRRHHRRNERNGDDYDYDEEGGVNRSKNRRGRDRRRFNNHDEDSSQQSDGEINDEYNDDEMDDRKMGGEPRMRRNDSRRPVGKISKDLGISANNLLNVLIMLGQPPRGTRRTVKEKCLIKGYYCHV
jgi:hypothetical protein